MEIKLRSFNGINIIDISGEIDLYNYYRLKEIVADLKLKGIKKYIINLEKVTYIDSSGIGALIFIYTALKEASGRLYLSCINGTVKRVIELTKLAGFLPIAATIQDAIKRLNSD